MKKRRSFITNTWVWILLGLGVYFFTRIFALTLLPVFADEAIYIRWAQLIVDDWKQYLFFPMNDGKTPLFVWLTVPALKTFADPLFAGRFVSVLAGLFQGIFTIQAVKKLKGNQAAQFFAGLSVLILPYWYFHHRMALMDGLMTTLLSGSWVFLLQASQQPPKKKIRFLSPSLIAAGLLFGLAIWTKLPAVLFVPSFVLIALFTEKKIWKKLPQNLTLSSAAILLGVVIFLALKLHPAFGQLFNRGNDFLYSFSELLSTGIWTVLFRNLNTVFQAYWQYLSPTLLLLTLVGLFQDTHRRKQFILLFSLASFLGAILLLGKTVYPRYILPSVFFITVSASLAFGEVVAQTQKRIKKPLSFFIRSGVLIILASVMVSQSMVFMLISWKDPNFLPFTLADRVQYLEEWSSGHGIREITDELLETAQQNSIAVATEGHFGTLPDGMLMYLHQENVTGILLQGIGQPVHHLSDDFQAKAPLYDQHWLVVNSHREKMNLANSRPELLLAEYCRPNQAPCLQVWDVNEFITPPTE